MTDDPRNDEPRHDPPARGRGRTPTRWHVFEPDIPDPGSEAMMDDRDDVTGDPLLGAVARTLRRPVPLDPRLDDRIMAAVAEGPHPARAAGRGARVVRRRATAADAAWAWLRRPLDLSITPLGGLSALAGLAAVALLTVRLTGTPGAVPVASSDAAPAIVAGTTSGRSTAGATAALAATGEATPQVVQFVLVAPDAQSVALVGDFNDWQPGATPLHAASAGRVWSVEVPLQAGRHRYAFIVDDHRWVPDPTAPRAPGDDFGTPNSVVTVAERRS